MLFREEFCGCEEEEGFLVQAARGSISQGLVGFGSEELSQSDLDPLLVSIAVVGLSEEDAVGGGDGQRDGLNAGCNRGSHICRVTVEIVEGGGVERVGVVGVVAAPWAGEWGSGGPCFV